MTELKQQISSLPDAPGIYRFYRADDQLIYVGKAKSLRKRVGSYFTKQVGHSLKTEKLVSEIERLEYTLVESEFDALLLENNFIKQYQPKYNILLRDDKTFPYLCILKEPYPRIISTRKFLPGQGQYFGPYTSVVAMKSVLELLRKLYTIRTCSLSLTDENISQRKFKVCLEYHIGNCLGPCERLQSEATYLEEIDQARNVLKGDLSIVKQYFQTKMKESATALAFEKAAYYKDKLELLDRFQTKSTIVNHKLSEIDVVAIVSSSVAAYVHYMQVKEGAIIFSKDVLVKKQLDETDDEILSIITEECRQLYQSNNRFILTNVSILVNGDRTENEVPQRGDKKQLVDLALKNAQHAKLKHEALQEENKARISENVIRLQKDLRLQKLPLIIECFDNSNLQGTSPVASMVRFVNGKPDKKGYRHFNIKTVTGANDFASMKEIVSRRYTRLVEENHEFPDLILVDGGKGQLASACEALQELQLYGRIPIVGIAKKLEEIYYPEDSLPLHLHKKSNGLLLIQRIRDEAHRFAITFHRQKRSKSTLASELTTIKGLGEKSVTLLLQHFGSPKKVFEATEEELHALIGKKKATLISAHNKKGS
jgi:excinuclease ABC subunit C